MFYTDHEKRGIKPVMKLVILIAAILFSHTSSLHAANTKAKKLVVLGDSVTEGYGVSREKAYPAILQEKIGRKKWMVINSGISGSTSASAEGRVKWILKEKPDLLILALGANDGLRGLDPKSMEKNLESAIAACEKAGVKVILAGMRMPPNYGEKYTSDFSQVFGRLARKHELTFIPFLLAGVAGDPKLNLTDGIHPNEEGHKIVAETVYRAIKGFL
jgi:acyl-CoA thioesterase-1